MSNRPLSGTSASPLQSPRSLQKSRREVMRAGVAITAAAMLTPHVRGADAVGALGSGERIVLGVMGLGGRGMGVAAGFASLPGVQVKYVCDVDEKKAGAAVLSVGKKAEAQKVAAPTALGDFRKALDDKEITALVIAAPNHWHAPAAILAATAGKHVYVEKPCSHTPREGELIVEAARKNNRCIQHGTQRRSWAKIIEAINKIKAGEIGPVRLARCWYTNVRKSIGKGKLANPPEGFDWALWQGPSPDMDFHDNYVPYNWHWFWQWGNGECGNNGVHGLDVGRWGLGVDCPKKVTSNGGRYYFDDDQQTPDTQFTTFDYGDKLLTWEGKSCHPRGPEGSGFGVAFYGESATIVCDSAGYVMYDLKNKEMSAGKPAAGESGDAVHFTNFLDAVRANDPKKLNAEVAEAASSTLLCHLANIAQRTEKTLHMDPVKKQLIGEPEAQKLWTKEYRKGWEPKV